MSVAKRLVEEQLAETIVQGQALSYAFREEERAAIVAWLRARADKQQCTAGGGDGWAALYQAADAIEAGEHLT